jgi:misacylated tRNA(Ala) deacylase
MPVNALYRDDAYLQSCEAIVTAIHEDGGVELDQTVFYATSGGQPGDSGSLTPIGGEPIAFAPAKHGADKSVIIHVPVDGPTALKIGDKVLCQIDWDRRYKLMRMHTACHLLSTLLPYPITGASVSDEDSRVDFDMGDGADKEEITAKLMQLVREDHPVFLKWISDEELIANPELVKSKNVRPPIGLGRVSLVCIGDNSAIDSQPCGGTHVAKTSEVGDIHISKIEKKGKENRRFRLRFGMPA